MKNIHRLIALCLSFLIITAAMGGCADSLDINKKRIVTAIILDYKDNQVYFNVEIANIESGSSDKDKSGGEKYKYFTGKGSTIMESKEDLNRNLDRQLYLSAIRTIVLTENFINKYIVEYLNRLRASEQYNKKVIIVTTKEEPKTMIDNCIEKNLSVGFSTEEMLGTLEKQGQTISQTIEEILEKLSKDNAAIMIPSIGIKNGTNAIVGYTVINNNNVKGFIDAYNADAEILFNHSKAKSNYLINYGMHELSIEGVLKSRKIKPTLKNGKISFKVVCEMKASLLYGDKKPPYDFDEIDYTSMEELLKKEIKSNLSMAINKAQNEIGCDYLHFDDAFRIKYPEKFEKMNWTEEFKNAEIDIEVSINLDSIWLMDYETQKIE